MQREITLEIQVVVELLRNTFAHLCGFSFPFFFIYYEIYGELQKILEERNLSPCGFCAKDRQKHTLKAVGVLRCDQFLTERNRKNVTQPNMVCASLGDGHCVDGKCRQVNCIEFLPLGITVQQSFKFSKHKQTFTLSIKSAFTTKDRTHK